MPVHSKTRAPADGGAAPTKTKTSVSAAGGGGDAAGSKRGPGGKAKGKAAICAEAKNAAAVKAVLGICRAAADAEELLANLRDEDLTLARVTAAPGGSHLVVTLIDGATGVVVPISKAVRVRGSVRTKGDLPNCMSTGDLVVLYGAMARGKISVALGDEIREIFDRLYVSVPAGFFPSDEESGAVGWCWGREEQRVGEEGAAVAAVETAAELAAAGVRAREGGYGDGRGALGAAGRDAVYGVRREVKKTATRSADDEEIDAI
jgi:hypothetical protein